MRRRPDSNRYSDGVYILNQDADLHGVASVAGVTGVAGAAGCEVFAVRCEHVDVMMDR